MISDARLSPKTKGVADIELRMQRLQAYEEWKPRAPIDFGDIVGLGNWEQHWRNHRSLVEKMKESQELADKMKLAILESGAI